MKHYDVIGDVHGQAGKLEALLRKMGYAKRQGAWRHSERVALFVGDFIDRGPLQLETLSIVRSMREAGSALAVMGNHELNAIGWATPDDLRQGRYLRRRDGAKGARNLLHHKEFLAQVGSDSAEHRALVDWFLTLPLWLDLPGLCVAHACWHPKAIETLKRALGPSGLLSRPALQQALSKGHGPMGGASAPSGELSVFDAVELVCKGVEIDLPAGGSYVDQDGITRSRVRSRWWDAKALSFKSAALLDQGAIDALPDAPIPESAKVETPEGKAVFFGHYWMSGVPSVLEGGVVCVDYSAARDGPLVAYRFDGEKTLSAERFEWSYGARSDLELGSRASVVEPSSKAALGPGRLA